MSTVSLFPNSNGKKDTVNAKQYQIRRLSASLSQEN